MKVLIYTHEFPPFLGGLATTSYKLAKGISESGIEVAVLAPSYGTEDKSVDSNLGARVIRIPAVGSGWIKVVPFLDILIGCLYLIRTLRREKPDLVLFITEEAETAGGLLPFYSFKHVVRVAGSGITTCFYGNKPSKKLMRFPMKRLYDHSDLIIAVSNNTKELLQSVGVPEDKIKVLYNGVEEEFISKKPCPSRIAAIRKRFGIPEASTVLITVARVLPRKGQDTVIKALSDVLGEFPNLVYLVVGEGRYKDKFKDLADEMGVSENVIFIGGIPHDEVVDFIDLSNIFIMPNRYWNNKIEGLPNALLEASARGKPVIAGNHGGSVEAVEDGATGLLTDPENVREVADSLLSLLRAPEKARLMGENGRKRVLQTHTQQAMIDSYVRALNSL